MDFHSDAAMGPEQASLQIAEILRQINEQYPYPEEVVESHLGSSGSNAKQVPELPPEAKKAVPKAKKSKGMGPVKSHNGPPKTSPVLSQSSSDTEPSSADSQASQKSDADNKKARSSFPPPSPAHHPKLQHFFAQDLQPPPRPPPGPPNMHHYLDHFLDLPDAKLEELFEQEMGSSCYAKREEPETNHQSVAAHAANWGEIIEQGGLPPGLPPGYPACPKSQANYPWRHAQNASPIAPPLVNSSSSTMAGFLNISPPPPPITSASQQTTDLRVMPPPPAVVPRTTASATIMSAAPPQAPSHRKHRAPPQAAPPQVPQGPNRESGGCRRNWEKQLQYATKKGARQEFLNRYGSWYPESREEDDEFLEQYRRDHPEGYIRIA